MLKTIFTSLSPNVELDDILLSIRVFFHPWLWRRGVAQSQFEKELQDFFQSKKVFLFESGRTSLFAIFSGLRLTKDDEVLIQAYTCVAVPNAVLWAKARAVYVDCDETFNMDPLDLEKKITSRSKAVVMQHTFGMPADIEAILDIAKRHNLFVIEDLAHSLGSTYKGRFLGTFGDAAFCSFGRDKVISSVFGGAVITNNYDLSVNLRYFHDSLPFPSYLWIVRQLSHPIITSFAKSTYDFFGFGKGIMFLSRILHLLSRAVYKAEKKGGKPRFVFKKMPNAQATLVLHQLAKLERFNDHRKKIASLYDRELKNTATLVLPKKKNGYDSIYLRYTVLTDRAFDIMRKAKERKVYLGDWYTTPIAPEGVSYSSMCFIMDQCPQAKKMSEQTVNLPTSIGISSSDAITITRLLKDLLIQG